MAQQAQLIEGTPVYIQGSGKKPYELKNTGGVYSCSCPAWRNQGAAIDKRTCKHLQKLLGRESEAARVGGSVAAPAATKVKKTKGLPAAAHGGEHKGKVITADAEYAQTVLDRAALEGRELRQDEKAKLHGPPVLLAHKFEDTKDVDPTGWWWSEKLDGVRAYWDGQNFISRQGNILHAPDWFKAGLPTDEVLDGELWIGRQQFQKTVSVVKRLDWGEGAKEVKFVIFDAPGWNGGHAGATFESRMNHVHNIVTAINKPGRFIAHQHELVKSIGHLQEKLKEVVAAGGEGVMIRQPGSLYETGRSSTLLKVKPFHDTEALVIGHKPGKGRHKGVMGACIVRMQSGVEFDLGTGFSDEERRNPPKVGDTVTFRYTELTIEGRPKCSSFICVRDYE